MAPGWRLRGPRCRVSGRFSRGIASRIRRRVHTIHWYQLDQELENPYLTPRTDGTNYHSTFGMLTGRLELGWRASEHCPVFAAVEQYGVVLKSGRSAVRAKTDPCARTDLTVGTVGLRLSF